MAKLKIVLLVDLYRLKENGMLDITWQFLADVPVLLLTGGNDKRNPPVSFSSARKTT